LKNYSVLIYNFLLELPVFVILIQVRLDSVFSVMHSHISSCKRNMKPHLNIMLLLESKASASCIREVRGFNTVRESKEE